jgi:glucose-1-phosphate thymidylyltransferase
MVSKAVLIAPTDQGPRHRPDGLARVAESDGARLALVPIANRPLLFHALDALQEAGIREVALLAPHGRGLELREQVGGDAAWGLALEWYEQDTAGTLERSLALVEDFVGDDPFVVHLGDSLSKGSLGPAVESASTAEHDVTVLVQDGALDARPPRVVELMGGQLGGLELAGVYVFGTGAIAASRGLAPHASYERDLLAAVQRLTELGGHLDTPRVSDWWRYRSRPDILLEANRFALEGLKSDLGDAQLVNTRIQGGVAIDCSARLESTIVRGPAIIGEGAKLRDAYVGPYTSIGAHVVIEGAEIENSIILPGASISHLGGRLESSVVGSRARVFRDFRLPRAMRLNVGEGAEVSLA